MTERIKILAVLSALAFAVSSCFGGGNGKGAAEDASAGTAEAEAVYPMGFNPDTLRMESGKVKSGDTLPGLLMRYGVPSAQAHDMVQATRESFDPRKMRYDSRVDAYYPLDSLATRPQYIVYHHDKIHSTIFGFQDSLYCYSYERATHQETKMSDVTISSSLWNDMIATGTTPLLIVELADIYAWTINFFGLQKGDRFRSIYTQTVCDDNADVVAVDSVLFCIYDSGDYHATAVRFNQQDGTGNRYWNEKGESMRKAFLKAPLKYNRISSRFTYHRKHPVTGKVKAHTAVDYAAPKGTPVHSIGDGTVTLCGWDGSGGGNRIKIRHMNGYETSYMHLSGYAKGIKAGVRVAQGQLIGYVGSTGTSTGPHLDFRVWKDGKPIDPLKMIAPPSEPLKSQNLDSLQVLVEAYGKMLEEQL